MSYSDQAADIVKAIVILIFGALIIGAILKAL